jgi:hypothetical protein
MESLHKSVVGDIKRHKKEFDMNKKNCVFGVVFVMMMVFGLVTMVGCPADSDSGSKNEEEQKVVAEQYRGTFVNGDDLKMILTKNTYQQPSNSPEAAYTEGNNLWVAKGGEFKQQGSFQDTNTFKSTGEVIYNRQNE